MNIVYWRALGRWGNGICVVEEREEMKDGSLLQEERSKKQLQDWIGSEESGKVARSLEQSKAPNSTGNSSSASSLILTAYSVINNVFAFKIEKNNRLYSIEHLQ